jgi:hypothetical protein
LRAPEAHLTQSPRSLGQLCLPGTSLFVILCLGNMIENIRETHQASFHRPLAKQLPVATISSS